MPYSWWTSPFIGKPASRQTGTKHFLSGRRDPQSDSLSLSGQKAEQKRILPRLCDPPQYGALLCYGAWTGTGTVERIVECAYLGTSLTFFRSQSTLDLEYLVWALESR
jgi:hypothetical protein